MEASRYLEISEVNRLLPGHDRMHAYFVARFERPGAVLQAAGVRSLLSRLFRRRGWCLTEAPTMYDRRSTELLRVGDELQARQFSARARSRQLAKFDATGHFDDAGKVREKFMPEIEVPQNVVGFEARARGQARKQRGSPAGPLARASIR